MTTNHVILHIPHSSTFIPGTCHFELSRSDLSQEIEKLTDHQTDKLFSYAGAAKLVFPVSRLVVDPERFIKDPMESVGMGVVYTHTSDGKPLRRLLGTDRQELIDAYYHPHHERLASMVDGCINQHGECLIIDCHSFPAQPLPYEKDHHRPDICIGTDPFHTDQTLTRTMVESFEVLGYTVSVNSPFSGTIVPLKHYHKDQRVASVMIEVNRSLYDSQSKFLKLQGVLAEVIENVARLTQDEHKKVACEDQCDFSELEEIIRLAFREQSSHPQGLNSSHTHGTLYPVDDSRNIKAPDSTRSKLTSHKLMRTRGGRL